MLIKRTATGLLALAALVTQGVLAVAQVPANSNLSYPTPSPSWENGSAPFAESAPGPWHNFSPAGPKGFAPQFDWFAPAETSSYGRGPRPHIGYFFSMERLFWSFAKPSATQVGSPTATGTAISFPDGIDPTSGLPILEQGIPTILTNTVDTNFLEANGAWGNRWELGYIDTDNYGWLVGILDHVSQSQFSEQNQVIMQFDDPANLLQGTDFFAIQTFDLQTFFITFDKIPIRFDRMYFQNITRLNGVELMRMYRAPRLHNGGFVEVLYGARWLQMMDTFNVYGANSFNSLITPPISPSQTSAVFGYFNPLSDSFWGTRALNNIVGPQVGLRWFRQRERWVTSLEARFLAGANFQAVHQRTNLGTNLLPNMELAPGPGLIDPDDPNFGEFWVPLIFQGIGSNSSKYATTFSPVGEIRVNVSYQATRAVGIKVGYTGMVVGNTTRASNRVDYSGPNLISITNGGENQLFFANGINFGIEINR